MGPRWASADLEPRQFNIEFETEVLTNYHGAWTLFSATRRGVLPVGVILAFLSHPNPDLSPFMIIGDMIWMPWASPRNKIETAVHFFSEIGKEIPMVEYAIDEHKGFFETIAKHGVMRRVGTSFSVYPDKPVAVFETRVI